MTEQAIDYKTARQALEAERTARVQAALEALKRGIEKVQQEYKVLVIVRPAFTADGRTVADWGIADNAQ